MILLAFMACCKLIWVQSVQAQDLFEGYKHLFTPPLGYVVSKATAKISIDGELNDKAWENAVWTNSFVDIEGKKKPVPAYSTKVKMLWDDSCLYIAAQLQEPHVWGTLKQRDDIIFNDNDFEVFIDPNNDTHQYYEFEVNALNTVFDLFLNKPYRNLGNAMINWNTSGLRSAVKVKGTLNNPTDTDEGWTVELAIPFSSLDLNGRGAPPADGAIWRINFSRVEWDKQISNGKYNRSTDKAGKRLPEHNWVWSAQGVVNMHYPERWGYLQFSNATTAASAFNMPDAEMKKQYLWLIYYKQKAYRDQHKRYALSLKELGMTDSVVVNKETIHLKLEATTRQFVATIGTKVAATYWVIDHDGLVRMVQMIDDQF